MNIGICTVHYAHNFGAMLQGYALKSYLESLGHHVCMVDRRRMSKIQWSPRRIEPPYWKSILLYPKYLIKWYLPAFLPTYQRYKNFERFLDRHLNNSIFSKRDMIDAVIFGSDQIWSKFNYGFNEVWWGKTIHDVEKISYAASMGVIDITEEDEQFIREALSDFQAISVRESSLRNILKIKNLAPGKDIVKVLDPVFLLNQEDWESITPKRIVKNDYLLFYDFQVDKNTTALVKRIAKDKNLEIVRLTNGVYMKNEGMTYFPSAGPEEFLSLMRYASFVVSSSFHGTAFAILNKKPFLARQVWNKDRVMDLLLSLGLERRWVDTIDDADFSSIIDYSKVDIHLKREIAYAKDFLSRALSNHLI